MNNWKTTLFGTLAVIGTYLHTTGVNIGHIGNTDVPTAIAAIAGTIFAWFAKDKNVTGGNTPQ